MHSASIPGNWFLMLELVIQLTCNDRQNKSDYSMPSICVHRENGVVREVTDRITRPEKNDRTFVPDRISKALSGSQLYLKANSPPGIADLPLVFQRWVKLAKSIHNQNCGSLCCFIKQVLIHMKHTQANTHF